MIRMGQVGSKNRMGQAGPKTRTGCRAHSGHPSRSRHQAYSCCPARPSCPARPGRRACSGCRARLGRPGRGVYFLPRLPKRGQFYGVYPHRNFFHEYNAFLTGSLHCLCDDYVVNMLHTLCKNLKYSTPRDT